MHTLFASVTSARWPRRAQALPSHLCTLNFLGIVSDDACTSWHEYIVFSSAQIIPCYVIHLDWGADNASHFLNIPAKSAWRPSTRALAPVTLFPGELVERKQALKNRALKWFPYGYGSATGTNFKIEEIGYVSEDEEDYGEYQAERKDGVSWEKGGWNVWDDEEEEGVEGGSGVRDEYADARKAWNEKKKKKEKVLEEDEEDD